ncbi:MAG: HXXEE domain-containing protein [Steroidobacteraceae bacterium]
MDLSWVTLRGLARSLPIVFALHVFEESLGFLQWFNDRVEPDLSWRTFVTVTSVCFVITVLVAAPLSASRDRAIGVVAVAWVGFLMFANGIVHIAASIVDGAYVPGLATAILLYLPVSLALFEAISFECRLPRSAVIAIALVAGIPMYLQGWLVLFRGTSLI